MPVVAVLAASLGHSPNAIALDLARGPYLQQGTPTSMIVRWRTDVPSASTLHYGESSDNLDTTLSTPELVVDHEIAIQNLAPKTKYFYDVGSPIAVLAGGDTDHFFTTSPIAGTREPTRVWVLGDSGVNSVESALVAQEYLNFAGSDLASVWLMLGDNAYDSGTDAEYTDTLFNNFPQILRNTPLWPTPGNHDFTGIPESSSPLTETGPYYDAFTLPRQGEAGGIPSGTETHYSFDYANIHFVALNTYIVPVTANSPVYQWLVEDLDATQQDWVIVFMHFPPYSRGKRDSDTDIQMMRARTIFAPIFESKGVDLVLTGHSHSYQRSVLIDGHYGVANTLTPDDIIDGGDGDPLGDGGYSKAVLGADPHSGTVYVVNGVAANALEDVGTFDHPVMIRGFTFEGSTLIDVDSGRLDAYFIARDGSILDRFRIEKGVAPVTSANESLLILLVVGLIASAAILGVRSNHEKQPP